MLNKIKRLLPEFEVKHIIDNLYQISKDGLTVPFFVEKKNIEADCESAKAAWERNA